MVAQEPAMTWAEHAADTLAEALNRPSRPEGAVVAVATIVGTIAGVAAVVVAILIAAGWKP